MDLPVEPALDCHVDGRCFLLHAAETSGRLMARQDQDGRLFWMCIDLGRVNFDRRESLLGVLIVEQTTDCDSSLSPGLTPTILGILRLSSFRSS
jgi:hypothetical protein